MTTKSLVMTSQGGIPGLPWKYVAKGTNRHLTVESSGLVMIRVPFWRWLAMSKDRKDGRPRMVSFPLWAIQGGYLRTHTWWRKGVLQLDVPAANDPWQRRTDKQRANNVFPASRPHRIKFRKRQQPWFVYAAEQIGVDAPELPKE
ncbi:MAG: hypothetical protein HOV87_12275 [Catenulispora sp.]|nr:hypothetical protein [Catenulispora sp.]NUT39976.1 hypothetical protein [Thermoactinospora sp.]